MSFSFWEKAVSSHTVCRLSQLLCEPRGAWSLAQHRAPGRPHPHMAGPLTSPSVGPAVCHLLQLLCWGSSFCHWTCPLARDAVSPEDTRHPTETPYEVLSRPFLQLPGSPHIPGFRIWPFFWSLSKSGCGAQQAFVSTSLSSHFPCWLQTLDCPSVALLQQPSPPSAFFSMPSTPPCWLASSVGL